MSKIVDIGINCPHCGKQYEAKVFRTFWGEGNTSRYKVYDDEINIVTCPHCGHSFHAPLAMMYVDCQAGFAVWWEPFHDDGIDSDIAAYKSMFGSNSYYAKAPRIQDWEEFKDTIRNFYSGELKASPIEKFDVAALKKAMQPQPQKKSSGCLGMFTALVAVSTSLVGLGVYSLIQIL